LSFGRNLPDILQQSAARLVFQTAGLACICGGFLQIDLFDM